MRCKGDRWYRSVDYRLYPNATQTRVLGHTLDVLCGLVIDMDRNAALNILSTGSVMRTLRSAVNGQSS
ncbi:hypothetical protein [Candidatus Methanoprimaticola sp. MG2]|uniref:hypothetical protein n=1 Tax=Candidatus Methanoprimaticola sp. MG2 TaxID=3228838 RepID=UPI0039C60140